MKYVKIDKIKKTVLLTINNGPFNTLSINVLKELNKALDDISLNKEIRSIIITGEGDKSFIAGADIKEMESMSKNEASRHSKLGQGIFSKIENFNKPIIAAINGYALGGGCELALSCHMRYAVDKALIGQPEVKLGLIAGFGGTQRLSKFVSKIMSFSLLVVSLSFVTLEFLITQKLFLISTFFELITLWNLKFKSN